MKFKDIYENIKKSRNFDRQLLQCDDGFISCWFHPVGNIFIIHYVSVLQMRRGIFTEFIDYLIGQKQAFAICGVQSREMDNWCKKHIGLAGSCYQGGDFTWEKFEIKSQ